MKKTILKSIALSLALTMAAALPVYAMTTDEIIKAWSDVVTLSVDSNNHNYLKIDGTEGSTPEEVVMKSWSVIASTGVIKANDFKTYYYDESYKYGITTAADAENALSKYNFCADWLKNNMPLICPTGTPMNEVIPRCIEWVCANLTYDSSAPVTGKDADYQSAYTAFNGSGLGVCATYSAAFVSMVSYVPIETGTSYVNWNTENVWYFESGQYMNNVHQWSAIKDPVTGTWRQYDITNYDSTGHHKYLELTSEMLTEDPDYQNPSFYPVISLRKASTK